MATSSPSRRRAARTLALVPAFALGACGFSSPSKPAPPPPPPESSPALQGAVTPAGARVEPAVYAAVPGTPGAMVSLAPLVESVKGAVVNVEVQSRAHPAMGGRMGLPPGLAERFGMQSPFGEMGGTPARQGLGSGFIIEPSGTVLTNNHVVEGADTVRVKLEDGRAFDAEVLGRDALTDVALLRLKGAPNDLPAVSLGDSDVLRVGDPVMAIGNPFGLASSVSAGILSARARDIHAGPYDDFLQTDAAINPGNSGGPLFNMKGEVVGMNTAIIGGATGIGFAVPANLIRAELPQLKDTGIVRRGWLGLAVQDLTPELSRALGLEAQKGAVVAGLNAGGPGARAGLREEDVITSVGEHAVDSAGALTRAVALLKPDSEVTVHVLRGGKPVEVQVALGTRPAQRGEEEVTPRDAPPHLSKRLGLQIGESTEGEGAQVMAVEPGSAAERGGLAPGMLLVQVGDRKISSARDAAEVLTRAKQGTALLLRVRMPGSDGVLLRAIEVPER
ncbi:peptidase S1 [Corallococcus sp. H22C18031201]|uniref:trypsin-like peptidase domain-containing protein n=1 Tax=Citreicoccus inhibens TaxID=2849499 RepID=UPI000E70F402|nr:trypsin-like peptidase domain-containing protein [Citreicoccus inhibens]MBU8896434.1 trypsin-like peptidase domain-containing protein [Citreicoccus inhibens]RJS24190.1 peptidase S1 [Corallococcus sp. H22C18031201]